MPCFSRVQTVLIEIADIEEAAKSLGITVVKHNPNRYTLRRGDEYITIERRAPGEKFETVSYSGSNNWPKEIIEPMVQGYAKIRLKKWAKTKGYSVTADPKKQGAFVLTSFK